MAGPGNKGSHTTLLDLSTIGFRGSPHIFGNSLGRELRELTLTNSNLIQYVHDLLIASPDFTSSQMDTIKTLNFLYEKGY